MIKLTNDYTVLWRIFFGGGAIAVHIFGIIIVFASNSPVMYVIYLIAAAMHFFVGKIWRYLLIKDLYISKDFETIMVMAAEKRLIFSRSKIIKLKTHSGITKLTLIDNGDERKFYFMINSKENLKYLSPLNAN